MGKIYLSEFDSFYTRLNSVRLKHNLATINRSVSGFLRASTMETMRTDLATTSAASEYIPDSSYITEFSAASVGMYIKQVTLSNIQGIITNIETVCAHNSVQYSANYSDLVDRDRDSDCSTNNASNDSTNKSSYDSDYATFKVRDGTNRSTDDSSFKQNNSAW